MIWRLTAAGREELARAALPKDKIRHDLLAKIAATTAFSESGLPHLADAADVQRLAMQGLIEIVEPAMNRSAPIRRRGESLVATRAPLSGPGSELGAAVTPARHRAASMASPPATESIDPGLLASAVRRLVAAELGIRGFAVALALEKAADLEELRSIAQRALDQIRTRRGEPAAVAARQSLFGA